jgi:16S rRNA (cytosine967-C5)-methyltransferase
LARGDFSPAAPALGAAARALEAVVARGRTLEDAQPSMPERERAAVRAIATGTVRWYLRLYPVIEKLLERPQGVPSLVRALLTCAAHQLEYSRNAPEPTVNGAVDATRLLGKPAAAGLVNAVLRRLLRERAALFAQVDRSLAQRTAHPKWLVERLEQSWPGLAARMLEASNEHPPMALRVDLTRRSASDYVRQLAQADIGAQAIQWLPSAVILDRPRPVEGLPGFAEGQVSVQDAAAQLAAGLLDLQPGLNVLDACAAPGGKTGHLLESVNGALSLTALDVSAARVRLIEENLARLKRRAHVVPGDLKEPATFWDGRPYQRILVDAPCSSTGVIRRHPDIKLLRRSSDIEPFAASQLALLRSAAGLLAPGGRLLYCTCSVLPQENEGVIAQLLREVPSLRPRALTATAQLIPGALERELGMQLLPGAEAGTDGFYYACLEKTTAGP